MIPKDEHRKELVRGLFSAAILASLLVGIPIFLIFGVGWPLPRSIPSGSEMVTSIRTGAIPSSFISKSVAILLWIVWLQLLAGVVVELWAHFHGRLAPQVAFVPRFMQNISARIIGTVLAISFSLQYPGLAMADNEELLTPTTIVENVEQEIVDQPVLESTAQQEDSLRPVAEQYLGDSNRWTEVYVLHQEDSPNAAEPPILPVQLQSKWELIMPVDVLPPESGDAEPGIAVKSNEPAKVPPVQYSFTEITVQKGDTLWGLAAFHLDNPEKWVDIYNLNKDIIQDPNLILPGWKLEIPQIARHVQMPLFFETTTESAVELAGEQIVDAAVEPAVTRIVEPTAESAIAPVPKSIVNPAAEPSALSHNRSIPAAAYTTAKPAVVAQVTTTDEKEHSAPTTQTILTIGGLGLFASSLGWVLARLRRNRRRCLPDGRMPVSLTRNAVQLEQQLQDTSEAGTALFLDASLRVMSSRFTGHTPPEVIGVTLALDGVLVLLDTPCEPPNGFDASNNNMVWTMPRREMLENLLVEAEGVLAPLPAMITLGKQSNGEFLLNLEHMNALSLQGDPAAIRELCSAVAVQLASSHLADDLTVICVGFGQDLSVLERVEYVPDVVSAIKRIAHQDRQNRAFLGRHLPSALSRIGNTGDYWHPAVALVADELTEQESRSLLEACGGSVCIMAHKLDGVGWVGSFDNAGLLLEPINLRLKPHGLSGGAVAAVAELAIAANDPQGVVSELPPRTHTPVPTPAGEPLPTAVEVRVMGAVDVLGAAQPFTSRRALDLVAYLAFNPDGADRDQLRAHLWPPDDPPSNSTLANTVSRARKALGTDSEGKPFLPRVSPKGIYRLRPEVGTDVARFDALASAAESSTGVRRRQQLQAALELVRGTPFTGGAGDMYRWADFGLRTQIDCMVDTVAHELAKRCMEAGDPEGARRAISISLRLVGECEQCYRWRLLAAAGRPTELRQIMDELLGLLKRDDNRPDADELLGLLKRDDNRPDADDLLSPDLLELYEQLMSDCMTVGQ